MSDDDRKSDLMDNSWSPQSRQKRVSSEETRERKRRWEREKRIRDRIRIGREYSRWETLRKTIGTDKNETVAKLLLDAWYSRGSVFCSRCAATIQLEDTALDTNRNPTPTLTITQDHCYGNTANGDPDSGEGRDVNTARVDSIEGEDDETGRVESDGEEDTDSCTENNGAEMFLCNKPDLPTDLVTNHGQDKQKNINCEKQDNGTVMAEPVTRILFVKVRDVSARPPADSSPNLEQQSTTQNSTTTEGSLMEENSALVNTTTAIIRTGNSDSTESVSGVQARTALPEILPSQSISEKQWESLPQGDATEQDTGTSEKVLCIKKEPLYIGYEPSDDLNHLEHPVNGNILGQIADDKESDNQLPSVVYPIKGSLVLNRAGITKSLCEAGVQREEFANSGTQTEYDVDVDTNTNNERRLRGRPRKSFQPQKVTRAMNEIEQNNNNPSQHSVDIKKGTLQSLRDHSRMAMLCIKRTKMPTLTPAERAKIYREKLKEDSLKMAQHKKKDRDRKHIARLKRTEEQKKRDREQGRIRQKRYRDRKKRDGIKNQDRKKRDGIKMKPVASKILTRKECEEKREYWRIKKRESRQNRSSEQIRRDKERDRNYQRNRRNVKRPHIIVIRKKKTPVKRPGSKVAEENVCQSELSNLDNDKEEELPVAKKRKKKDDDPDFDPEESEPNTSDCKVESDLGPSVRDSKNYSDFVGRAKNGRFCKKKIVIVVNKPAEAEGIEAESNRGIVSINKEKEITQTPFIESVTGEVIAQKKKYKDITVKLEEHKVGEENDCQSELSNLDTDEEEKLPIAKKRKKKDDDDPDFDPEESELNNSDCEVESDFRRSRRESKTYSNSTGRAKNGRFCKKKVIIVVRKPLEAKGIQAGSSGGIASINKKKEMTQTPFIVQKRPYIRRMQSETGEVIERKSKYEDITVKLEEHEDKYEMTTYTSQAKSDRSLDIALKSYSRFTCKLCDGSYNTRDKTYMEEHIKYHLQGRLACKECGKIFSTIQNVREHYARVHKIRDFICEMCAQSFCNLKSLNHHLSSIHNEKPFKCPKCTESFSSDTAMREHMYETHPGSVLKCEVCKGIFSSKATLTFHQASANCRNQANKGSERIPCEQCGKLVIRPRMGQHIQRAHLKIHTFKCDKCPYTASTSCRIKFHMMTHTGEHPYRCDLCNFSCIKPSQLKCHMRTHTGDKPYKCDLCSYASAWNVQLKGHKKAHDSPSKVDCKQCNITFKDDRGLSLHTKKEHCEDPATGESRYRTLRQCNINNFYKKGKTNMSAPFNNSQPVEQGIADFYRNEQQTIETDVSYRSKTIPYQKRDDSRELGLSELEMSAGYLYRPFMNF